MAMSPVCSAARVVADMMIANSRVRALFHSRAAFVAQPCPLRLTKRGGGEQTDSRLTEVNITQGDNHENN